MSLHTGRDNLGPKNSVISDSMSSVTSLKYKKVHCITEVSAFSKQNRFDFWQGIGTNQMDGVCFLIYF